MMNFWISDQPENDWNVGFDGGQNMPWYARYDYVEYWEYVPEDKWDVTLDGPLCTANLIKHDYGKRGCRGLLGDPGRQGVYREKTYTDEAFNVRRKETIDECFFWK